MIRRSSYFSMFVCAILFYTVSSKTLSPVEDDTCQSYFTVCNDLETARRCESIEWCECQGAACGALEQLKKNSPGLFGNSMNAAATLCDNNFMAFKRPVGVKKIMNIRFEIDDDQSPFSFRFYFDGNKVSLVEQTEKKIAIRMNDRN